MIKQDNILLASSRNVQIVLYLLKRYGIRKVIASPGTQNMELVVSMQRDSFFEMYSAADERSAAYMACGLSAESNEPVVLSCTGATASRNYLPGLTEAYYRHLKIIAITSTERENKIGHNIAQIIDRRTSLNDTVKISVVANAIDTLDDEWNCEIQVNKALLEPNHHGPGPIHINLEKQGVTSFTTKRLPSCRVIERTPLFESFPLLPKGKIGIFVGSHTKWEANITKMIDLFCEEFDAVVFCDHTSNFKGEYRVLSSLVASQDWYTSDIFDLDILIQLGEISGEYYECGKLSNGVKEVWRVNEDGIIRDQFKKLKYIFEMPEENFFKHYVSNSHVKKKTFYNRCTTEYNDIYDRINEKKLPLCNIWIAKLLAPVLPENCFIHFGILNSLRSWNFFEIPNSVQSSSNVGGFGIDGGVSTLVGASLANPNKLHFGVFGDLAFFYDMNSLGNHHLGANLRIMLINNGIGTEFKLYSHPASKFGNEADAFIAASGHYGSCSSVLIKHYAEDLGFVYISANNKEEFLQRFPNFINANHSDKPVFFEVFTSSSAENEALRTVNNLKQSSLNQRKSMIKKMIGEQSISSVRKIINIIKNR